jgi:hypothetical protein
VELSGQALPGSAGHLPGLGEDLRAPRGVDRHQSEGQGCCDRRCQSLFALKLAQVRPGPFWAVAWGRSVQPQNSRTLNTRPVEGADLKESAPENFGFSVTAAG